MSSHSPPEVTDDQDAHADDATALVRELARELAIAGHAPSLEALEEPRLGIARLTAGLDADDVDSNSAAFRFGAAEALATVLNGLAEQVLSDSSVRLLGKSQRARVLNALVAHAGKSQKAVANKLGIKESNFSQYIRELAGAGLIEPAVSSGSHGKAWALSPWGVQTYFAVVAGPAAELVPNDELSKGLEAAVRLRAAPAGLTLPASSTIPKDEVYKRLDEALSRKSDEPIRLSTLYAGDLREHARPWQLHKRAIKEGRISRPVHWVVRRNETTEGWFSDLIEGARGNTCLTIYALDDVPDPVPTVQVLDSEGLVFPLLPDECGLVQSRAVALAGWEQLRSGARLCVEEGNLIEGILA